MNWPGHLMADAASYAFNYVRTLQNLYQVTLVDRMRPHCTGSIHALVKWAGAAALNDTAAAERVRRSTLQLRKETTAALETLGYKVLRRLTAGQVANGDVPCAVEFRRRLG